MEPGDYILQLSWADNNRKGQVASQFVQFDVVPSISLAPVGRVRHSAPDLALTSPVAPVAFLYTTD